MKRFVFGLLLITSGLLSYADPTIVDTWGDVKVPPPPELVPVKADPASTALLLLDFQVQTVSPRPRAVATVPRVKVLLERARAAHVLVAYSVTTSGNREAILAPVQPLPDEHVVKASVDKFFGTDLDESLKAHGIRQVIVTGIVADGAVLGTSIGASLRGFKVIVPVDGTASANPYSEQYVAYHLMNAPLVKGNVTLTRTDWIEF